MLESVDDEDSMSSAIGCRLALMRTQTARMLDLLRDAVDRDLQPEEVAVRSLVAEIISAANARRRATVTMNDGDEQLLCTYPAALWRAVANVLDNAIRAAGPAGRVEVSVYDLPPHVVIEVVDDGPGFGKAPAGTASLGLGIAASLAKQCGGTVEILSAYPHGVRVRLEFRDLGTPTGQYANADRRIGRA